MSKDKSYTDVGMILPGAPKMRAKAMVDGMDFSSLLVNIADSLGIDPSEAQETGYDANDDLDHHLLEEWRAGLSKDKLWPAPSYGALIEAGVPIQAAVFVKALRDTLPRHAHNPSPSTLEAFAELVTAGRTLAERFIAHWEETLKPLPTETPTYGRIFQTAALIDQLSSEASNANIRANAYPIPAAPELPDIVANTITQGFESTPDYRVEIHDLMRASLEYSEADQRLSYRFNNIDTRPSRKTRHELSYLEQRTKKSLYEADRTFRNLYRRVSERLAEPVADESLPHRFEILRQLKISLPTLAAAEKKAPANQKPAKARRPTRLTEREAQALLRSPEDDGEDAEKYQDLTDLVDMGMVRGIQWGEWVPQKERAVLVKNIFESFQHFALGMQITPSLAGLGNPVSLEQRNDLREDGLYESNFSGTESLGLALGARGKSAAAAHYEPGLHTINLTRLNGAGALAHEMFHGLDYKLTQLLELSYINDSCHKTDVRKTTSSKKGITTFSELLAHHWSMETHLTDRNRRGPIQPELFKRENERLISRALRPEYSRDKEFVERVMPLMVGFGEFIREMYHRDRDPEEMLERAIEKHTDRLVYPAFELSAENLNSFLAPDVQAGRLPAHLAVITEHITTLAGSSCPAASDHAIYRLKGAIHNIVSADDTELKEDLSNWENTDLIWKIDSLGRQAGHYAAEQLASLIKRDLPEKVAELIKKQISTSFEMLGRQAILLEHARRELRNINSPHAAIEKFSRDRMEQVSEAFKVTLSVAPTSILEQLSNLGSDLKETDAALNKLLLDLEPTAEARIAGVENVNLYGDNDTASLAKEWVSAFASLERRVAAFGWDTGGKQIAVLRKLCDARKTPPNRDLIQVSGYMLEALKQAYSSIVTTLEGDQGLLHTMLDNELREHLNLPKDISPGVMYQNLMNTGLNTATVRHLTANECKLLSSQIITAAYKHSTMYDGNLSTWIKVLRDPTLLGEECPKSLLPLYENMAAFQEVEFENQEASGALDIKLCAAYIAKSITSRIVSTNLIEAGRQSSEACRSHLANIHVNDTLISVLTAAVKTGELSGLESLEKLFAEVGPSFRYMTSNEKREAIASLAGADAKNLYEMIGEDAFSKVVLDHNYKEHRSREPLEELAETIIHGSQRIESRLRSVRNHDHFLSDVKFAKQALDNLNMSRRAPSEVLLHSAAYDECHIGQSNFLINPGSKRGYWYSAKEMFARCSEAALYDTLAAQGISSPYLVTVPTPEKQDEALKKLPRGQHPGQSAHLNYPAGEERKHFASVFQKEVIPHMENALSTLFPEAVVAYESYQKRQEELAARDNMLKRIDSEPDERMLPQSEAPTDARAADDNQHAITSTEIEAPDPNDVLPAASIGVGANDEPGVVMTTQVGDTPSLF